MLDPGVLTVRLADASKYTVSALAFHAMPQCFVGRKDAYKLSMMMSSRTGYSAEGCSYSSGTREHGTPIAIKFRMRYDI